MLEGPNKTQGPVINSRPNKLLLTFSEASNVLSVSPTMLRKLVRKGSLKVTHIGRCARLSYEEVLRLSNGQQSEVTNG